MDTRLLKKIKRDYTIVKVTDPKTSEEPIYRLLRKGKKVKYAWIPATNESDFRLLILSVAHGINWEYTVGNTADELQHAVSQNQKSRKESRVSKNAYAKAVPVWP